ncbi:MAG: hypothetical protein IIB54_07520 [Planctomycetes bacterium]|nr:hypothetical protein [Planctomycetota bacterium]
MLKKSTAAVMCRPVTMVIMMGLGCVLFAAGPGDIRDQGGRDKASFSLNRAEIRAGALQGGKVILRDVPLGDKMKVDLELERFFVTDSDTRFVVGNRSGRDRPLDFDPNSIVLLRGQAAGYPESSVFLAITDSASVGRISLGGNTGAYAISSRDATGKDLPGGRVSIFPVSRSTSLPAGVTFCGTPSPDPATLSPLDKAVAVIAPSTIGRRQIDLAIETDYELFEMIGGNLADAATYIVSLYGAISDIYIRDVNASFYLSFVRLWDNPLDLFNEPDPLGPFLTYWNANMGAVVRDAAQFNSGRRDIPYGGAAYLSELCTPWAYSVCGYMVGAFPDPSMPSAEHYDIHVAAHELGHNCGTLHTHDYGIDTCDDFNGPQTRGTIMSYCSQTRSGGNTNTDLRLHKTVQGFILNYITANVCVITDCNENGVDDLDDIANFISADVNANNIPDECEDCNNNSVLDDLDIAGLFSTDFDGNGIPDECEPDCNNNDIPDAWDIAMGTSFDLHGNNIPDECETDCDLDGVSDYNQIMVDMTLDIDRNARLDDCQDCDLDGINDLLALNGGHNVWSASNIAGDIKEYHAVSGVQTGVSVPGFIINPQDLIITDDGRILVSSAGDSRIVQFDRTGAYVGDFVTAGLGGLNVPTSMIIGPNGNLFVASLRTDSVLEYDGTTGAFVGVFVDPPPPPLAAPGAKSLPVAYAINPFGIGFGPNGNFYVTSSTNEVMEFDGVTGAFISIFVTAASNGGLDTPRQILFKPNGNLIVASFMTKEILEYDAITGAPLGKFNNGGTDAALTFDNPWGLRYGPDGFIYASRNGAVTVPSSQQDADIAALHINSTRIYKFDANSGAFMLSYVLGNDSGLDRPTGFDFMPGDDVDCNYNLIPDACDIGFGSSLDVNANLIPDECECLPDSDGSGSVNVTDLLGLLASWGPCSPPCLPDTNFDGFVNVTDLLVLLGAWGACP